MRFYRRLSPIAAISFDLDDTLYDNYPVIVNMEKAMFQWLVQRFPVCQHVTPQDWQRLKANVAKQQPGLSDDMTAWRHETLRILLMQFGVSAAEANAAADEGIALVMDARHRIAVPEMTHTVLAALAERWPLVAITNGNADVGRIGLEGYFQFSLQGGVDGLAKPHAALFEKTVQRLQIAPNQLLHVGDHLTADVAGAREAGVMACWINLHYQRLGRERKARHLPDVEITQLSQLMHFL
uniref:5-amino-6-(5-phospho-D-ribitylamino)uracil phosphatase YigB n=1 Tax=Thaumasiovibrio occultus TaxID=1891184 RepID=UPI000B362B1B|nr:5-amino-6-(5-phospho-D-ribitylamino)uracil phosphatase YigB [Thaumasiovibrio occultus]